MAPIRSRHGRRFPAFEACQLRPATDDSLGVRTEAVEIAPPMAPPQAGQLARVGSRVWVVGDAVRDWHASQDEPPVRHLVSRVAVEGDAFPSLAAVRPREAPA